jgi:hypothetical protein
MTFGAPVVPAKMVEVPNPPEIPRLGRIAQLVEQLTLNQRVLGSSPSAPTKFPNKISRLGGLRSVDQAGLVFVSA